MFAGGGDEEQKVAEDGTQSEKERERVALLSVFLMFTLLFTLPDGRCSKSRERHTVEQNEYVTYLSVSAEGMSDRTVTHVARKRMLVAMVTAILPLPPSLPSCFD